MSCVKQSYYISAVWKFKAFKSKAQALEVQALTLALEVQALAVVLALRNQALDLALALRGQALLTSLLLTGKQTGQPILH